MYVLSLQYTININTFLAAPLAVLVSARTYNSIQTLHKKTKSNFITRPRLKFGLRSDYTEKPNAIRQKVILLLSNANGPLVDKLFYITTYANSDG